MNSPSPSSDSTTASPALTSTTAPLPSAVAWTRAVAVASVLGLIGLGLAWELFLAPTGQRTLALKVLPLALPLAGLMKNRMYTYRWVSLFIWFYFIEGVIRATGDRGVSAVLAMLEVALCLILFTACAAHVRWRLKHGKAQPHNAACPMQNQPD